MVRVVADEDVEDVIVVVATLPVEPLSVLALARSPALELLLLVALLVVLLVVLPVMLLAVLLAVSFVVTTHVVGTRRWKQEVSDPPSMTNGALLAVSLLPSSTSTEAFVPAMRFVSQLTEVA